MKYTLVTLAAAGLAFAAPALAAPSVQDLLGPVARLSAPQPPARLIVDAPLAEPLSRGTIFIQYRAENLRILPVFGTKALEVSPRIGHVHVTVDDTPWHWADASGNPIIVAGLAPGAHKIELILADANHQKLDRQVVEAVVPEAAASSHH